MSRTDVHRPGWVKERDPHLRHLFREHHNHATGPCDLQDYLTGQGWTRTRCYLAYTGGRNIFCGCQLCTEQHGRKLARRQERSWWRTARQRLLAAAPQDRDAVDVPPFRSSAW
jgi:hypothetical protein